MGGERAGGQCALAINSLAGSGESPDYAYMIAIKIENPSRVARAFGECAGDYAEEECKYWVGNPWDLSPVSVEPAEWIKVIKAPVKVCGGQAWIEHPRRWRAERSTFGKFKLPAGKRHHPMERELGWAIRQHSDNRMRATCGEPRIIVGFRPNPLPLP